MNIGLVARVELGRGDIEREEDVLAELVAGVLGGLRDHVERGLGALELRGEAAFVTDGGAQALLLQHALEGVEDLGDRLQTLAEGLKAVGLDHELLEIDRGVRVGAAVDDVGHRDGQHLGVGSTEVLVEGLAEGAGGGLRVGEGDGEDRVRAELGLGFGTVERQHDRVHGELVERVHALDRRGDLVGDVLDGLAHALAEVTGLDAVAQLDGLVLAGGGPGGHRRAAEDAGVEDDIDLDGGIATGVEDFTGLDFSDLGHVLGTFS